MADMPPMISFSSPAAALLVTTLVCANGYAAIGHSDVQRAERIARPLVNPLQPTPTLQPPQTGLLALTIPKAADGLFYVTGKVNGKPVRFLLDTGANMVVLTPDDARRAGVASSGTRPGDHIDTASGESRIDRVTLNQVFVAGHGVDNVEAAVMRSGLKVSLLGQNMLSKLGPITLAGEQITLRSPR